jgi:hypothetical protein
LALDDAMRSLDDASNQQINWAVGNLLRRRALRDDWRQSAILQHLETRAQNLNAWNELFRRTREALANDDELPRRAQAILKPDKASFDAALDDFIAEMLAAEYLSLLGHQNIRFPSEEDPITTDLISVREGLSYVIEAKNLREPISLSYVAFARWHENRASDPNAFDFTVEFLDLEDPFEDLSAAQASAIRNLVDTLPNRPRPSTFRVTLPGDRTVCIQIGEGRGVMLQYGPGPFLVNSVVEECQRSLVVKLMEPTRKALSQLYSAAVPIDYRRLLFVRWKPPEELLAIGEADNVRGNVQDSLQAFIRSFFPRFALAVLHTGEEPERTPRAHWP